MLQPGARTHRRVGVLYQVWRTGQQFYNSRTILWSGVHTSAANLNNRGKLQEILCMHILNRVPTYTLHHGYMFYIVSSIYVHVYTYRSRREIERKSSISAVRSEKAAICIIQCCHTTPALLYIECSH